MRTCVRLVGEGRRRREQDALIIFGDVADAVEQLCAPRTGLMSYLDSSHRLTQW